MSASTAVTTVQNTWDAWSPVAGVIGGFATGLAAAFAGGALWFAHNQIRANSAVAREQEAQAVYSDYLRLCIEYPECSSTTLALKYLPSGSVENLSEQLTPESERYVWFVSYMLSACEKILLTCPDEDEWQSTIKAQISYHKPSLKEIWRDIEGYYAPPLRQIVENEVFHA